MSPDLRKQFRNLENRIIGTARHPAARSVLDQPLAPWSVQALAGYRYCLFVSYRQDGSAVTTPVWFAPLDDQAIVVRSGAEDPKLRRIRRNPSVLIAACDARGRPLGPPMPGSARIIQAAEADAAEAALRTALGWRRRLYNLIRAPLLPMAYLEIRGLDSPSW